MPYAKKTKHRPSVTKRAKIAAAVCIALALALVFGGLYMKQQERLEANAAQASQYSPAPIATATAGPVLPVVAFIGDSYTQGAGTSAPTNRWSARAAKELGWDEENFGRGGTGYLATGGNGCGLSECLNYREMIPQVAAAQPETVVVAGGRNDGDFTDDEIRSGISAFYTDLRAALPEARIIAISPTGDDPNQTSESVAAMTAAVRDAASAAGAEFVDIGQPLQDPALVSDDGVHPNNDGHAALADAVVAALR